MLPVDQRAALLLVDRQAALPFADERPRENAGPRTLVCPIVSTPRHRFEVEVEVEVEVDGEVEVEVEGGGVRCGSFAG
jgi:hypothetical protein